MTHRIRALLDLGQSIWLDNIHRDMLEKGELKTLIEQDGLRGITSNPTIFEKAITGSQAYDTFISQRLKQAPTLTSEQLFIDLAVRDTGEAADLFKGVYESSQGHDGMVSIEVSPQLAHDTTGTVAEGRELHARLNRPNIMIKVPATREGIPAIEALLAEGINVNVTLLFSVERYQAVLEAYLRALETRLSKGLPIDRIASVASFFVSRVDTAIDKTLSTHGDTSLQGKAAIANAKLAYAHLQRVKGSARFRRLAAAGARIQRLLWASTSSKNPNYSDVVYVDHLIGDETVNTLPPTTFDAFRDHGTPRNTLTEGYTEAATLIDQLATVGINLGGVTQQLEDEGVAAFKTSFVNLIDALTQKRQKLGLAA
jgi:transaldolase